MQDSYRPLLDSRSTTAHRFGGSRRGGPMNYELYMAEAIAEARRGAEEGENPVGAVAVIDDAMIARDHHRVGLSEDPTAHAVLLTVQAAARQARDATAGRGDDLHDPRAVRDVRRRAPRDAGPSARLRRAGPGAWRRRERHPARPRPIAAAPAVGRVRASARARRAGWHRSPRRSRAPSAPSWPPARAALDSPAAWRGVRVVEGAALEKRCAGNRTVGSNPTLSAIRHRHRGEVA